MRAAGSAKPTPGESTPRPTGFEVHWSVLWSLRVMLAVAVVAVPVLSWGSLVRLVQDMATLAPPFSCGPCVTKECIENERAESAMAYLGLLERRVREPHSGGDASTTGYTVKFNRQRRENALVTRRSSRGSSKLLVLVPVSVIFTLSRLDPPAGQTPCRNRWRT